MKVGFIVKAEKSGPYYIITYNKEISDVKRRLVKILCFKLWNVAERIC